MVCCNVMRIIIRLTSIYCLSNDGGCSGRFYDTVCCTIFCGYCTGPGLVSVTQRSVMWTSPTGAVRRTIICNKTRQPEGFQTFGVFVSSQKNTTNSAQRLKNTKQEQTWQIIAIFEEIKNNHAEIIKITSTTFDTYRNKLHEIQNTHA